VIPLAIEYIVHGFVQGVGYRSYVRTMAIKYGIKGSVKNLSNGSVKILAYGTDDFIKEFEKGISVNIKGRIDVRRIEKRKVKDKEVPDDFVIEKDKS
jgi:acylphosphatase